METTILQVPVSKSLRVQAAKAAQKMGFSSLQEVVRVLMAKLAQGMLVVEFRENVRLSPKAEKRYLAMEEDFKKGRNVYKASSVEDFFRQLDEN